MLGAAGLGAGTVPLLATGCSNDGDGSAGGPDENSDAARRLRADEGARRRALLARYDGTVAAHGALAGRLKPLRGAVARQASALDGKKDGEAGAGRGRDGDTAGVPSREAGVPSKEKDALAALAEAETRVADRHTAALIGAPPELARLLASVAAAGAAHACLLEDGSGSGSGKADGRGDA